jgi:hypothetical protein
MPSHLVAGDAQSDADDETWQGRGLAQLIEALEHAQECLLAHVRVIGTRPEEPPDQSLHERRVFLPDGPASLSVTPARRTDEQTIVFARIGGYKLRRRRRVDHGTKQSFPVILWRIAP